MSKGSSDVTSVNNLPISIGSPRERSHDSVIRARRCQLGVLSR